MEVNLMTLMQDFDTDAECRAILEDLRWPDGVRCLRCQGDKCYHDSKRKQYDCASCGYQFSVTAGTIFHDTHLPLPKWFIATYLMCESKKGISANQLKRTIGVSYKTAWYLCHRIRAAMKDAAAPMLSGIVEVDETFVGGKKRGVGRGSTRDKTMVIGAVERGGSVRFRIAARRNKKTLHNFVSTVVDGNADAIHTDDWFAYRGVTGGKTRHEVVNHSQDEWVRADVHTNTVEGVWSLFKRSIVGSYHQLSTKHMPAYLDEMAWRFNNRRNEYLFRDTLTKLITADTLEYKTLIS